MVILIVVIGDLQFVLSTGNGVNGFTLDPSLGEFILTHPDIKVGNAVIYIGIVRNRITSFKSPLFVAILIKILFQNFQTSQ